MILQKTDIKFKSITVCLDMHGCPNRCKHCWLGATPNGNMPDSELSIVAEQFRPFARNLEVVDWYREPDYKDNYKEMWELCKKLSDKQIAPNHFEVISDWRIVRDSEYVKWLSSLGLKKAQLTLFGSEETTDYFTGRKGAYKEILQAIDILLENGIAPRIQTFVYKTNIDELPLLGKLILDLELEERCKKIGSEFSFFIHQGSCDGESEKLYDVWVTPEDLEKIPERLTEYTLKHFGEKSIEKVFGQTEQELYNKLIKDRSTDSYVDKTPVFYIDKDFNVYPNNTTPAPHWCLSNLKTDGARAVLKNYLNSKSVAQNTRLSVPICDIVRECGDPDSSRLFGKNDYIDLMLNRYCRLKMLL